jgi:ubiquinone biosynthesis protein
MRRRLSYLVRVLVMGAVLTWFLLVYAFGRLVRAIVHWGDRERRRRSIAHWKGKLLRQAMATLGATFVKLGQVLSTRPDLLEPEVIEELRQLQDRMPAFPMEDARRSIERTLGGRLEDHYAEFDAAPVAAASVAQVHRARLPDGAEVAVKILRPDVREKVERDSAVMLTFARLIAAHPTWRLSDPVGHLEHFVGGILDQTNLRLEQEHYAHFRQFFAETPGVRFPKVYPALSGERVLTMEFMRGTKVDKLPAGGDHRLVARRLQQVVLKMCFEDGFFHADLHPGNVLVTDGDEIVIFDAGLVKRLDEQVLLQFMDFTKCLAMGTPKDFVEHLQRFHKYLDGVDWVGVERDLGAFITRYRQQNVSELEMGGLMNEVFALGRKYKVHPLPDLALVIVGLVTAEGIGKQLNPHNNLFADTAAYLLPLLAKRGLALSAPPMGATAPPPYPTDSKAH